MFDCILFHFHFYWQPGQGCREKSTAAWYGIHNDYIYSFLGAFERVEPVELNRGNSRTLGQGARFAPPVTITPAVYVTFDGDGLMMRNDPDQTRPTLGSSCGLVRVACLGGAKVRVLDFLYPSLRTFRPLFGVIRAD